MQFELPTLPVVANTRHLFCLQEELLQRSLGRDYQPATVGKRRKPRFGAFEIYLEVSILDGLGGNHVSMLLPVTSKLESKKWPDVRRVSQLVLSKVTDKVQHLVLKSIDAQHRTFIHQVLHSSLQYTFTQQLHLTWDEAPTAPDVDIWSEALKVETWEAASVRELQIIPQMLIRSKSWRLLHEILCSLHFLAAKLRKCGLNAVVRDLESAQAVVNESTSAAYQTSDHGAESKHLSMAAASLQVCRLPTQRSTCIAIYT